MIRPFERVDARRIKPNQFSDCKDMWFVFDDPEFYKFSLVGNEADVFAIICFRKYWGNNYLAFFLIDENMPMIHARELKRFIYEAASDLGAERVQTDSVDCELLTKWHEFLGFKHEGKREKMIYNQDYSMWAILRGRDF